MSGALETQDKPERNKQGNRSEAMSEFLAPFPDHLHVYWVNENQGALLLGIDHDADRPVNSDFRTECNRNEHLMPQDNGVRKRFAPLLALLGLFPNRQDDSVRRQRPAMCCIEASPGSADGSSNVGSRETDEASTKNTTPTNPREAVEVSRLPSYKQTRSHLQLCLAFRMACEVKSAQRCHSAHNPSSPQCAEVRNALEQGQLDLSVARCRASLCECGEVRL